MLGRNREKKEEHRTIRNQRPTMASIVSTNPHPREHERLLMVLLTLMMLVVIAGDAATGGVMVAGAVCGGVCITWLRQ